MEEETHAATKEGTAFTTEEMNSYTRVTRLS